MENFIIFLFSGCIGFVLGYAMSCIFSIAKDADEQVRKLEERKGKESSDDET